MQNLRALAIGSPQEIGLVDLAVVAADDFGYMDRTSFLDAMSVNITYTDNYVKASVGLLLATNGSQ